MSKKKKKPVTYTVLILDQSGSMSSRRAEAVNFYNEHVQQAKLNSSDQDIRVCLITFNGQVFEHLWDVPADQLCESTDEDYLTAGSTAYHDALGYAISKLEETTDTEDPNISYLLIAVNDGENNASTHFTASWIKKKTEALQKTNRWTFSAMADKEETAKKMERELGIPITNMAVWDTQDSENARYANRRSADLVGGYYQARSAGASATSALYSSDAGKCANFTDPGLTHDTTGQSWGVNRGVDESFAVTVGGTNQPTPVQQNVVRTRCSTIGGVGSGAKLSNVFKNHTPVEW